MNTKKLFLIILFLLISLILLAKVKTIEIKSSRKIQNLIAEKSIGLDENLPITQNFVIADDKIFFINPLQKLLLICDLNGNLIKTIDNKGKGPGEFSMPTTIFDDKINSRIAVIDQMNKRISYFDYNGNHIKDAKFEYTKIPMDTKYIMGNKVFYYMGLEINKEKNSLLSKPTIELIKYDTTVIIYSQTYNPLNMNLGKSKIPIFEVSDNKIYVATLTPEKYEINIFDNNGNHIAILKKKIKKIKRSKEEIKKIEEKLEKAKKQAKSAGSNMKLDFKGYHYANLINNLLVDMKKNLWVLTLDDNGYYFDVIDKYYKPIKKVFVGQKNSSTFKIYKNKLYEIEGNEDTGYHLKIYNID